MAENVLKLKKQAVSLGMDRDAAKRANRKQLEDFISNAKDGKSSGGKKLAKKKHAPETPAKKTGAKKKTAAKPERKKTAEKPSRKAPAAKKSAKKAGEAKRPSNADNNGVGRISLGSIDWNATSDEWNPKPGGPVERLFKALKKRRGDVDKAFDDLKGDVWDFVGKKLRNGEKRSKESAHAMLRYRLNRTKFEFAVRTGQHQSATDRVEYGTGTYATTRRKGGKKTTSGKQDAKKPPRKAENKKTPRKPAASKKTTSKKTAGKKRAKK